MKRCLMLLFSGCLFAASVQAATPEPDFAALPFIQATQFVLEADEVVTDERWISAPSIVLDGDAQDDLFLFSLDDLLLFALTEKTDSSKTNSGTIRLNGSVAGDVWAAGKIIEVRGPVEHHLRTLSPMLLLDSRLGGNLWSAAKTVSLETNAIVVGSARILADYFILRGTVDGNLVVKARKVVIDGTVNGSVSVQATEVEILANTRIRGALVCESPGSIMPDRQAVIEGGITRRESPSARPRILFDLLTTLLAFSGAILVGIFFLLFAPRLAVRSTLWMETYPWRTLLVGMAAITLTPFVIFFMFVSLLGIPLGMVTAALYGLGVYLGRFVAALSIARLLTGKRRSQPIPVPSPRLLLLGLAFFYGATFLPDFMKDAIWFWFTVTGLGGLIMASRRAPLPVFPTPPPVPKSETNDTAP